MNRPGQRLLAVANKTTTNGLKDHDTVSKKEVISGPTWKPDIYIDAFVPESYLAINRSAAIPIDSTPLEGVNFPSYVASFAGTHLLSSLQEVQQAPAFGGKRPMRPIEELNAEYYGEHFNDCLALDLAARIPELQNYSLFGVLVIPVEPTSTDPIPNIHRLQVPGIREGTPQVALGDSILLRQLIIDPITHLPQNMNLWLKNDGIARGIYAPGFTGYQISSVVVAIDRKDETLLVRADGFIPGFHKCNISFVVSTRVVKALQRAVVDINQGLPLQQPIAVASVHERAWLQRMLFPLDADGTIQHGLPSGVFSQTWFDESLNYEQMKAVDAVQGRLLRTPILIHGPPGTGKTKTICEAVTQLAEDESFRGSILLCAPSDQAADTLAIRLCAQFEPRLLFRLNDYSRTFAEVPQKLLPYCYVENDLFSLPPFPTLMGYKIVVTTCQTANTLVEARVTNRDLVSLKRGLQSMIHPHRVKSVPGPDDILHWEALFIDEAAQATEPETLIPLAVVAPTLEIEHDELTKDLIFVMAGDHYQLGPRTYAKSTSLHISLFERLSARSLYASHPLARKSKKTPLQTQPMNRRPFVNLTRNYRSHPAIIAIPSSLFYANTLIPEATQIGSLHSWNAWRGRCWPVLFACNGGADDCEDVRTSGGAGWYNIREAQKAIEYSQNLISSGHVAAQSDICIMSPFRAQVNYIRRLARKSHFYGLNIGPVEAFQGLESRFVIICTTRAQSRFLDADKVRGIGMIDEPKKFNVAITRAKEGLIVLGNPRVLSRDPCWRSFLHFCWRNGLWQAETQDIDPRMQDEEADVNSWVPEGKDTDDEIQGLEAALLYKEKDAGRGSKAAKRFLGPSREDEAYGYGLEVEAATDLEGDGDRWEDGDRGEDGEEVDEEAVVGDEDDEGEGLKHELSDLKERLERLTTL